LFGILSYKDKYGAQWTETGQFNNQYQLNGNGRRKQEENLKAIGNFVNGTAEKNLVMEKERI
jgi:hypothetical protein